jgi:hypothetical protein
MWQWSGLAFAGSVAMPAGHEVGSRDHRTGPQHAVVNGTRAIALWALIGAIECWLGAWSRTKYVARTIIVCMHVLAPSGCR